MKTAEKVPHGQCKNKTEEEARRLGISKAQLLSYYHEGIVPGTWVSDRIILFTPEVTDIALAIHANRKEKEKNGNS